MQKDFIKKRSSKTLGTRVSCEAGTRLGGKNIMTTLKLNFLDMTCFTDPFTGNTSKLGISKMLFPKRSIPQKVLYLHM